VVILLVLVVTTIASMLRVRTHPKERAHAGTLRKPRHKQAEEEPAIK
jgi:tellurite resistance protein TerC